MLAVRLVTDWMWLQTLFLPNMCSATKIWTLAMSLVKCDRIDAEHELLLPVTGI